MDTPFKLRLALLVCASLSAIAAEASPFGSHPMAEADKRFPLKLVDQRSYHHCHNLPRRTSCHKDEVIPGIWTTTPNKRSLQRFYPERPRASTIGRSHAPRE